MKIPYHTAKAFCEGNESAIKEVYLSLRKLLYFVIRSIVNNEEDANDIYQNVFIKVIANAKTIKKPEALQSYFLETAKSEALNFVKKNQRQDLLEDADVLYGEDDAPSPYLESYYPFLTPRENAVVVLHLEEGLSFREIEALAKLSRQTIANAYESALKKLKTYYQEKRS